MAFRFAVLGDSIAQGFQDGAIGRDFPLRSFPAIMARAMGLSVGSGSTHDFRVPAIPGDGLPLDIVKLLARVGRETGANISKFEWVTDVIPEVARYFDELEDFYEARVGSRPLGFRGVYHNLATYGLTVYESANLTSAKCDRLILDSEGWFRDDVLGTPSGAKYRAAKMVLDPDGRRPHATQLDNLDYLVNGNPALGIDAEPLDALVVWLGANDCLRTVIDLEVNEMPAMGPDDVAERAAYNLTSSSQFRADFQALADRVDMVLGERDIRVFVGTVPDVTIPPLAKGLGKLESDVYDFYVRFFVPDGDRPPFLHKRLKREQVAGVQERIREFNLDVRAIAGVRPRWHVAETGAALAEIAVRRNRQQEEAPLRAYYERRGQPNHPLLAPELRPVPSLSTLRTDSTGKRIGGGLTSLDGIHPSTAGNGLAAEVFLEAMKTRGGVDAAEPGNIDWAGVIDADRCLQHAPAVWDDFLAAAERKSLLWDTLFRTLSSRL